MPLNVKNNDGAIRSKYCDPPGRILRLIIVVLLSEIHIMSGKEQSENSIPSTPLEGNSSSSNVLDQNTSPVLYQQPSVQPVLLGPQPPVKCGVGLPSYREPPPSYQAAMAYPAASGPYSTNSDDTVFPKPYSAVPPYPLLSVQNQMFPPTSPPPLPSVSLQPPPVAVPRAGHCAYCGVGILSGQTDLFCLICLVLLAVCTFPVGLLFLCFIPCTVHKRCSHCRRIG
uniref:Membrane protein BRI3 n=1 Tax=Elaeophora elaphi TaxID=1147741 RepID=A0A0R3RWN3_9BILA